MESEFSSADERQQQLPNYSSIDFENEVSIIKTNENLPSYSFCVLNK
jgi:hypothetical protein